MSVPLSRRVEKRDWPAALAELDARGHARIPGLLAADECARLAELYDRAERFRSRIVMERHAFGVGEYKYFGYPLPPAVQALREAIYPHLAPLARAWAPRIGLDTRFPDTLDAFLAICRAAGQPKPTPLLLRYERDGYNCLHQDLYGAVVFPFQLTILLSRPGRDFSGGELLLVEQRPRAQSLGAVVALEQGDAVLFATRERPVAGRRGTYRAKLRHGVSRVTAGCRFALGIIFHDAA